jgi:hypothetical protein
MIQAMLLSLIDLTRLPRLLKILPVFWFLWFASISLQAQTGISTITTSTVAGTNTSNVAVAPSDAGNSISDDAGETFTINYGQGNNLKVVSYTVSAVTYNRFLAPDTLVLNRTTASDRLVNIWFTLNSAIVDNTPPTNDVVNLDANEVEDADAIYLSGNLNAGYDNILVNIDDAASGSIEVETERVDVIWYQGIQTSSPSTAVFPIIERGGNDNIAVAAITSLNVDGTPASYSTLIGIPENGWPGTGSSFNNYLVLRRESAGSIPLPLLPIGTFEGQSAQVIQGVAISFSTFGIAANTPVYGYSIFSADVVNGFVTNTNDILPSGAVSVKAGIDLTDISTFPTDSRSNDSGLDLVAGVSAAVASDDNLIEVKGPGGYKAALSTWLKANADVTTATDGSPVTDWQDQWLGNHDATTGVASPTFRSTTSQINFNPTVDFTSGNTSLNIANNSDFNTPGPFTKKGINLSFRTSTTDINTRQVIYEQGGNTRGINIYIRNGNLHLTAWNRASDGAGSPWNNGGTITTISAAVTTNTEYIVTLEENGNSGATGTITGYLNGQSFGSIPNVGILYNHTGGIELGGSDGSTQYDDGTNGSTNSYWGEISELIYCNEPGSFPTTQRQRIESYLAIKYGITLNQSTPINYYNSDGDIIFNTTLNASLGGFLEYNNDIAGIGRDDASELDQPASRSENTGSVVTMDRGATISTDDTWLIWGNDGAALTETTGLTMPDTIDSRLNRVWRVAEQNEVFSTSVSFDITGLGLSTNQNDFSLLIASNSSAADFSNATVISGGVLVGSVLTFTGVNLDDGQYFTLGTSYFQCSPGGVLNNLTLWLRADDGTSTIVNGTDVATWTDRSGFGNTATGVVDDQPSYISNSINYNPALDFDAGNTEEISGSAGFNSSAYYMVINTDAAYTSASAQESIMEFVVPGAATDQFGSLLLGSATGAFAGELITHAIGGTGTRWRRGTSQTAFGAISDNTTLMFGVKDNAGATDTEIFVNGRNQVDLTSGTILTSSDVAYRIGGNLDANTFSNDNFDGQIAEVISYSARPSDAEHARIQTYLSIKYGITLSNNGGGIAGDYTSAASTLIWDASDYSTYHNDVAGIGRDDLSCLEQKQSKSVNTSSIVAIGLGTIAASNAANPNSFGTDETFMLWGSDGDFTTQANANTADLPGNVTERMERIWRVNETNTVGNTTVQFDINGLGYSTNVSDFQLIRSSTATMASGSLTPAASLVGGILTFNNVNFADGDFFTIGTARTACGPGGVTTNLELWLRADAEVFNTGTTPATDGQTVNSWSDQSTSAANALDPSNLAQYRINAANFNPALEFFNDATSLEASITTTTAGLTLITAAFVNSTSADNDALFEFRKTTATAARSFFTKRRYGGTNNFVTRITQDSWNIWSINHPAGSTASIFQNGATFIASHTANQSTAPAGTYNYTLGDDDDGGARFDGFLGDVIAFGGTLTTTERRQIETYLAIKYGVTISQTSATNYIWSDGSTVLWNGTTNSTHNQDIAGIGRDDASCFSQKQSQSINSDDVLTIGLSSVAASNAENVNSFEDDGDYLIWGNDGGATAQASANTADVPGVISERMTRIWKVQDTGLVGETELQFDLTGLGYSVADAEAFSLLVGNTSTMADATIITGGTLNGSVLSFTGIDLTDGQFFTIGTGYVTCGPGGVNSNIALWLRADVEVFSDAGTTAAVDGNNALQWNDQSSPADNGSEVNLGGGSPIEPTFQTSEINFNPILRFSDPNSSNASYIETSSNSVSGNMTLISVFKTGQTAGTANDFVNSPALIGASVTASTADYGLGMDNGTIWMKASNDGDAFDVETGATFNNNRVHFTTATRTAAGAIVIYVDGNSEATGTGNSAALTGPSSFGIGNHSDADLDAQFAGDIAETIVFSAVLSSDERNRVESYLALKYGMTMNASDDGATGAVDERDYRAADGGVIWDYTGQTTTYYNDIFGIGRDDLSCFEQTQSKSENLDAIVSFNLPAGFGTTDSFILSGNDGAAIEQVGNKERPAEINSRLNREWRVQETGTVGSIQVTYDLDEVTGPLGVGTNNLSLLRLMVDDDGDFTTGATLISPTSFNGTNNTVTFTVNFTDGQYYTLGSTEVAALPITLLSFEANKINKNQVKLDWATADETNNSFFTIERSANGIDFEAIANLQGAGNSESTNLYHWVDSNPIIGNNFYRLKQTDFNGEFSISEMVRVFIEFDAKTIQFNVYPNPIQIGESLNIKYAVSEESILEIKFVSTSGQVLLKQTESVFPESGNISLSTDKLQRGLVLVMITDLNTHQKQTFKILVR